jgi:DNA-binding CsgD family transcriptional regulator
MNHASSLGGAPDFERARQLLDEVDELVDHFGFRRYAVYAAQMRAQVECRAGDLEAAGRALGRVDDRFLDGMETWVRAVAQAEIDISRGAFDAVLNRLTPDVVGLPQPQDTEFAIQTASFRADARSWLGDREGARRDVDEGESHVRHHPDVFFHGWLAMVGVRNEADAATAASAEGSLDAVELAQQRAASTIEMWNATLAELVSTSDLVEAQSSAVAAEWARLQDEDAVPAARRAAERFGAISMPYYETYFRWRESEAMLDAGERATATEVLKRARAVAIDRGFAGLVDAINALARSNQLRLGPANTTVDGANALSVRELEVLRLMVDGRSNTEIAERLFISRRTAAAHVSNILRKLDASSRVEAVTEAHRRGVV